MTINPQRQRRILDWLESRGVSIQCPWCKSDDWYIHDEVFALQAVDNTGSRIRVGEGQNFSGAHVVSIVCNNCQSVHLFSPVGMGILPGEEGK